MAYDEDLANRVRELIAGEPDVTEKKMFGGPAFLVGGNMSVGGTGQGGLMVRVDPKDTDALVTKPHARPFEMRARAMQGWLRVEAEGLRTKRQLEARGRVRARSSSKAGATATEQQRTTGQLGHSAGVSRPLIDVHARRSARGRSAAVPRCRGRVRLVAMPRRLPLRGPASRT